MPGIISVIIELSICICVLWLVSFLSTLLHELGHAVGYMLSTGGRHWHIRVGSGKKLFETKALTVKLLVFDGSFDPVEDRIDTKAKLISTLSGGPVASLLLIILLLFLRFGNVSFDSGIITSSAVESFISFALFYNMFTLVLSIIPAHYFFGEIKGMETDGLRIINAIRSKEEP